VTVIDVGRPGSIANSWSQTRESARDSHSHTRSGRGVRPAGSGGALRGGDRTRPPRRRGRPQQKAAGPKALQATGAQQLRPPSPRSGRAGRGRPSRSTPGWHCHPGNGARRPRRAGAGPPTTRPNTGSPSKRGKQSQSMAPWLETTAAVRVSPSSP
jgi:hypothetical protein